MKNTKIYAALLFLSPMLAAQAEGKVAEHILGNGLNVPDNEC